MVKRVAYFYVLVVVSALFVLLSLADSLPFNTLKIQLRIDKRVFALFPQGWAFFTKSPQEAKGQLFKIEDGKYEIFHHNNAANKFYFGLSRGSSRINYELTAVYNQLHDTDWTDGYSNIQVGWVDSIPSKIRYIKNPFDDPRLTGEYMLVLQELVPWAWSEKLDIEKMPCKKIRVVVQ